MSTPKSNKTVLWVECSVCSTTFLRRDSDIHSQSCTETTSYSFPHIRNRTLKSDLDLKKNVEVKGLSTESIDNLVFLSQSAIQLCELSIGDWAVLKIENFPPLVKKAWPTVEKNVSSILLTKNVFELYDLKTSLSVSLRKIPSFKDISTLRITVTMLGNASKSFSKYLQEDLIKRLIHTYKDTIICVGNKLRVFFFGKIIKFVVNNIEELNGDIAVQMLNLSVSDNESFYLLSEKSQWFILNRNIENNETKESHLKIGGLQNEFKELDGIINAMFNSKHNLSPNSILLYGHSGTGKTMLVNSITEQIKMNVVKMNAAEIFSKYISSPEEIIRKCFDDAIEGSPSILIIDEVDLLCSIRSTRSTDSEKRIHSTLLTILDYLHQGGSEAKVLIISITNKIDSIDSCFRRHGRLGREIEIPTPNSKSREDILKKMIMEINHNLNENELQDISLRTHGFVGTDLASLCNRAVMNSSANMKTQIDIHDFEFALHKVKPSAMREVQIEVPNVKWAEIGGQEKLKLILKQSVEWPLKHADSFTRLGITPPKGILMFGPPGCSKTMIAKALATESGLNFLSIKGPELFSKWVGESERAVREVFRKARQVAPSIIFFDEIDALGGERSSGNSTSSVQERVLAQLLTELDGITPLNDVTILAATNRPDRIDKALLRPGRLDRIVYVPLPDAKTRKEIFNIKFQKIPVQNIDLDSLVERTEFYSGAEINAVCQEAAMKALEENLNATVVTDRHFEEALKIITPRTSTSLKDLYENYLSQNK